MSSIFNNLLLEKKFNSFREFEEFLIISMNNNSLSKTQIGHIFEEFNYYYFKIFSKRYRIKNCWSHRDIPIEVLERLKLKNDQGADGVIETIDGKFYIYQTKFKSKRNAPTNNELKKTIAESQFSDGAYIFTNAYDVTDYIKKFNPYLILFEDLEKLGKSFFMEIEDILSNKKNTEKKIFTKTKYQLKAIENIKNGFKNNDIGQYISACGTGKTLTSLWIKEELGYKKTLFVVPSIWLIKQTVEKWIDQRKLDFNFFCVVSNIGERPDENNHDSFDINPAELGVPYSTKTNEIESFINKNKNNNFVIFSTYHSLNLIYEATKEDPILFDITFYDEAHRTAGLEKKIFSLCFEKNKILSSKKLFMTATPKVVKPKTKNKAIENNISYYSMDDTENYGTVFEEFSFRDAISENAIVDYEIIIQVIPSNNDEFHKLDGYSIVGDKKISNERITLSLGVKKLYEDFDIKKAINFSNSIKRSRQFISDLSEEYLGNDAIGFKYHIGSDQNAESRKKILNEFKNAKTGLLSNARCLTEGIDVPSVDAVIFSDKKGSVIDIVQAVGRCLRIDRENPNKIAKIYIPITLSDNYDVINFEKYSHLFEIIEAIKAHDSSLVDEINQIHLGEITSGTGGTKKIKIIPYKNLDITKVRELLTLEISKLNKGEITLLKKKLLSEKNKSINVDFQICRYNITGWFNLVKRGIEVLQNQTLSKSEFRDNYMKKFGKKIDNNLISHMGRAGLLEDSQNFFQLSHIGRVFYANQSEENFRTLLSEHLLSRDEIHWYPYMMIKQVFLNFREINNLEFIYGPYICKNTKNDEIEKCKNRIQYIKSMNIDFDYYLTNLNSLTKLINDLNHNFRDNFIEGGFDAKDFLKRGRCAGEFNYCCDHLTNLWGKEFLKQQNKLLILT
jgi:predicted helicase